MDHDANVTLKPERLIPSVFSTSQAAALCGVDRRTMLRWVKARMLPSHQTGGGWRRILRDDLLRFMRSRGIPLPAQERACIVVADDDRAHVAAMRRLLQLAVPNARVVAVYDGFAAGLQVAQLRPQLLLLDIVMPGLDGETVCREVRSDPSLTSTAIVVISGVLDRAREGELLRLGAERFLHKPVRPEQVLQAVRDFVPACAEHLQGVAS